MAKSTGSATGDAASLCDGFSGAYSLPFHIGAIFMVLAATVLGTVVPLVAQRVPLLRRNPVVFGLLKALSTGVLFSVAVIHLIGSGTKIFEEKCVPASLTEFYAALPLLTVVAAILVMHLIDYILAVLIQWHVRSWQQEESAGETSSPGSASLSTNVLQGKSTASDRAASGSRFPEQQAGHSQPPAVEDCGGHAHLPVLPMHHGGDATSAARLRHVISSIGMQLGVTLHSLLGGLIVGLTTDAALKPLLIAFMLHQFFEGMSMGSRLVEADFSIFVEVIMTIILALGMPVGMSITTIVISVNKSAMAGPVFVVFVSLAQCFCGGILLYLAFIFLMEDFASDMKRFCSADASCSGLKKVAMFLLLWLGMIAMAALGKWI